MDKSTDGLMGVLGAWETAKQGPFWTHGLIDLWTIWEHGKSGASAAPKALLRSGELAVRSSGLTERLFAGWGLSKQRGGIKQLFATVTYMKRSLPLGGYDFIYSVTTRFIYFQSHTKYTSQNQEILLIQGD
jgi:hypothetical protein